MRQRILKSLFLSDGWEKKGERSFMKDMKGYTCEAIPTDDGVVVLIYNGRMFHQYKFIHLYPCRRTRRQTEKLFSRFTELLGRKLELAISYKPETRRNNG